MSSESLLHDYPFHERREMLGFIPPSARRVLDVGCGSGGFGSVLTGREVFGVEPNPRAADLAEQHYAGIFRGLFPDCVPAVERFDCIAFLDVLEHLVDPGAAVRATRDLLAPGGSVVASIPNMRNIDVLTGLLLRADWTYQDEGVLDRTHLRFFTYRTMRALFEENGFVVRELTPINVSQGRRGRILTRLPKVSDMAALQFAVVASPAP